MGWFKSVRRVIENSAKSGTRAASALFDGNVGGSASYGANPAAGRKETRERYTRRGGGFVSGAVGAFIGSGGNPIAAVIGGVIGAARAGKGKGQTKHYATSFAIGVGTGITYMYAAEYGNQFSAGSYVKGAETALSAYSAYAQSRGAGRVPEEGGGWGYEYPVYYENPYENYMENLNGGSEGGGGGGWMGPTDNNKSDSGMEGALLLAGALLITARWS